MSGIAHAVGKVFKGIGSVVKKVWKPLAIAAAVYFTGGLAGAWALPEMFGGAAAAGGAAAGAADAFGAAEAGGFGVGDLAAAGGAAADAGEMGGVGMLSSLGGDAAAGTGALTTAGETGSVFGGAGSLSPNIAGWTGTGTGTSSAWSNALGVAKNIMGIPGVPGALGGLLQGYEQGQMMNKMLAYKEAHAPGQLNPGATSNAFGGFAHSGNTAPMAMPGGTFGQTTEGNRYTPTDPTLPGGITSSPLGSPFDPTKLQGYAAPAPGTNPGYGLPGYGMTPLQGGLGSGVLSNGPPFMEDPYQEQPPWA